MNKKVEYNPTPVYYRPLVREVLRHQVINKNGYHNVNEQMTEYFKKFQSAYKSGLLGTNV